MQRTTLAVITPPLAIWRFCSVSSCAAPISVFWATGIFSIIYGYFGGPVNEAGASPYTIILGMIMWGIASAWSYLTVRGAESCKTDRINGADKNNPHALDEFDPIDEVRRAR